jgi:hypothetical protein
VSFAAITLCVASQRGFIVVSVYFVIDSVRKLLDTPSSVTGEQSRSSTVLRHDVVEGVRSVETFTVSTHLVLTCIY